MLNNNIIRILIIFLSFNSIQAQEEVFEFDTSGLIKSAYIPFASDYEKNLFEIQFKDSIDSYFELFMNIDNINDSSLIESNKPQFTAVLKKIENSGIMDLTVEEKMKKLFKVVHEDLLGDYSYENKFCEIFEDGKYNCVGGTATYAMVFEYFDIPYIVKETPTHVYSVAYPDSYVIMIESTSPKHGAVVFSEKRKQSFVDALIEKSIIREEDILKKGYNHIFEENYFSPTELTVKELIGIQYLNISAYSYYYGYKKKAIDNAIKAYLFYPVELTKERLLRYTKEYMEKNRYRNMSDVDLLGQYIRYMKFYDDVDVKRIMRDYKKMIKHNLFDRDKIGFAEEAHTRLLDYSDFNDSLACEMEKAYHKINAEYYYNKMDNEKAMFYSQIYLKEDSLDRKVRKIYTKTLSRMLLDSINRKKGCESVFEASNLFPYLKEDEGFKRLYITAFLGSRLNIDNEVFIRKSLKGIDNKKNVKIKYDNQSLVKRCIKTSDDLVLGKDKLKAKEILELGLHYVPNNEELIKALKKLP